MSRFTNMRNHIVGKVYDLDQKNMNAMITELESQEAKIQELVTLLEIADCPNCNGDGAYYDGMGNVCQCQWCYERELALTSCK